MEKNMRKDIKDRISKIEGANLRRLREERGWTQEQLAEALDANPKYISQLEGGSVGIGPDVIMRYCEYFNITPEDLYNAENKKAGKLPPMAQMLLDEIMSMPLHEQTRLLADIQEKKLKLM